jgi:sensor histidine kinase YesM
LLKLRIEDRLVYRIDVPQGLESTIFPPMVLQSLVENAIKHGIEPKPEGGQITVSAQVVNGNLRVEVADTGIGLKADNVYAASTQGTGLGLDNIRERLAMLYPGRSKLSLQPGSPSGTVVQLEIPYQADLGVVHDTP